MELIQYEPQTETVFETPLLASPPSINKYYIMDLAPGRSFIEWAVTHGHTTFAISYRNPDAAMRDVSFDDYLLGGPLAALDVMAEITGADQANIGALCPGGTLATMLLAWLRFSPWQDLVWNYVASNWLMGHNPPAFDILAWNADNTRMPAAMHARYLRSCYLDNELAQGRMELAGRRLRLDDITTDTYLLSAKEDHIAPWRSSYKATQLLKCDLRFVLSSSGHIAGIVNPPGPKARHWTNPGLPANPDDWLAKADAKQTSWWEDWATWIEPRAGKQRQPPRTGSKAHPALADAPGSYVRQK